MYHLLFFSPYGNPCILPEAESKEKHAGVDYKPHLMSTPESTATHLPWATQCQSRP
jgi:hypothetical protein